MRKGVVGRVALVGACAAGVAASVITYRSETRIESGFRQVGEGRSDPATARLLEGAKTPLNPNRAREFGLAAILLRRGRGAEAEALMVDLTRKEPDNAFAWFGLTRVRVARGRTAAARESWRRAAELDSQIDVERLPPPA